MMAVLTDGGIGISDAARGRRRAIHARVLAAARLRFPV